jgi:hypothetical protein
LKPSSSTARAEQRIDWRAGALAGIVAGIVATAVQLLLWLAFTDALPQILFRDARLAAAIILGPGVLPPPADFDAGVMLAATLVHFALSIIYGLALAALIAPLDWYRSALAGNAFGLVLYGVNMYGFTAVFPWFAATRDWITLAAHLAFGVSAAAAYRAWVARG